MRPTTPVHAVVVAAGRSTRMGAAPDRKPFLDLAGRPVLAVTCAALAAARCVASLVVGVAAEDVERARAALGDEVAGKPLRVVAGGAERTDSVAAGVEALGTPEGPALVAIHDGARPLVSPEAVEAVAARAEETGAALLALAVRDTLKRSDPQGAAVDTLPRAGLFGAQTPQVFDLARFRDLLARARAEGFSPTDDAALWERWVGPVALVEGSPSNFKITTPDDLELARAWLALRGEERSRS